MAIISSPDLTRAVEITAHRGASHRAPENTLAAVDRAWKLDADSVEVDVRQSVDGQIVVIHDETTGRTAAENLRVAETPLVRLRRLDVGGWKSPAWKGERIPTLAEVCATIPDGKRLIIEIKCGPEVARELGRVLRESRKMGEQFAVIAFDMRVLKAFKSAVPDVHVQWIVKKLPDSNLTVAEAVSTCRQSGFDGLSVGPDSEFDAAFVKEVHDAGLELHVWTVNSPIEAQELTNLGVDAITTDRPGYILESLQ